MWCWRRLLRVPWTARRSNQSILKEISPEYSLEWLMLKPKLQYSGHLMWRTDSLEKTLMLGKIEGGRRGWDGWMASPTWWMWVWVSSGSWWWTGKPECCSPWGRKELDRTDWLNWTIMRWGLPPQANLSCWDKAHSTTAISWSYLSPFSSLKSLELTMESYRMSDFVYHCWASVQFSSVDHSQKLVVLLWHCLDVKVLFFSEIYLVIGSDAFKTLLCFRSISLTEI